jgi:DNA-binding transcriptional regulator LsrR (DeoR family)
MKVNLTHIKTIHDLAKNGSTGRPEDLARRLGISTRSLSNLIRFMKEELEIPIQYNRQKQTYLCLEDGYVNFRFQKNEDIANRLMGLIKSFISISFWYLGVVF